MFSGFQKSNVPSFVKRTHKEPYPAIDPTQPALSARGKTILVTGGGSGIGFFISRAFAAAGADTIAILGRRASVLETAAVAITKQYPSTKVLFYTADVGDSHSISKALKKAVDDIPSHGIDILVTNAAYFPPAASPTQITAEFISSAYMTNVIGNLNLVQRFLETPSSSKKIILDVSTEATWLPYPQTAVYGASKAGFTHIMKHLQIDQEEKVRIHSFHPGGIWTEAAEAFGYDREATKGLWDHDDLPAHFAVWLASDEAEFLKGKFVLSKWDVEDLQENKEAFKDPLFSTLALHI
ncbi:NAD(P)-binding protein [Corynespora cassiicola Philippines]|uniref:NAD(P)-binding protein n=1 Tax=Corynespora cassiicola Philippines TaxID=1448308 RepID=A0A2T2NCL0_CORCC|nr:NAD(P)-binding protein [Corynespora cassiicola Philippines]